MIVPEYGYTPYMRHPRYYRARAIRRMFRPHIFRRRKRRVGLRRGFRTGISMFKPTLRKGYMSRYIRSIYPVPSVLMIRPIMASRYISPRIRPTYYTYKRGRQFLI